MVWPTLGSRTAKEQEQSTVVQVIKSLQDPLEVGNNLPSLSWSSSPSFHVFRHPDRDDDCPQDLVLWNRGRSIDSTCSRAQVSLRRLLKPTLIGLHHGRAYTHSSLLMDANHGRPARGFPITPHSCTVEAYGSQNMLVRLRSAIPSIHRRSHRYFCRCCRRTLTTRDTQTDIQTPDRCFSLSAGTRSAFFHSWLIYYYYYF